VRPVLVLLAALLLVLYRRVHEGDARTLARRCVRRAVLDGGVSVPEVAEVVDVARRQEGTSGEGVDGCISPLAYC
jgi:hypothetical protein